MTAANRTGAWLAPIVSLLGRLGLAVPPGMTVVVLADRGWWRPKRWAGIGELGWHLRLRLRPDVTLRPAGGTPVRATTLLPGPGHAWIGTGLACKERTQRLPGTLLAVWEGGQSEPWLLLTDLDPTAVGPARYGLRVWVELGFRRLKSLGFHWERTRRTDPTRLARQWLVVAVATLWTVAVGTPVEDAERWEREPAGVRQRACASCCLPHRGCFSTRSVSSGMA